MLKFMGVIVWIGIILVWLCWPNPSVAFFAQTLVLFGVSFIVGNLALFIWRLNNRQKETEERVDHIDEFLLDVFDGDDPNDPGDPEEVPDDKVIEFKNFRRRA